MQKSVHCHCITKVIHATTEVSYMFPFFKKKKKFKE